MKKKLVWWLRFRAFCALATALWFSVGCADLFAQEATSKPAGEPPAQHAEKTGKPEKEANPAQIELLETKVRFETNGDNRKEVHALVKINSELGVRQFAQLNFDFNRSFESIEIPLVHITHANGGTADILPSAITDRPNPAVVKAPAYQDVRVKSVRILGLQPGDTLEYRVIRTVSHHPLAPDFWLDHTFDRSGVVSREIFELDLPASKEIQIKVNPATTPASKKTSGEGQQTRVVYQWDRPFSGEDGLDAGSPGRESDVLLTTFPTWASLSEKLDSKLRAPSNVAPEIVAKAGELTHNSKNFVDELEAFYDFLSRDIATIDLPLGSTGFKTRTPVDILSSKIATQEDKYTLFSAFAHSVGISTNAILAGAPAATEIELPTPKPFTHLLIGSFQQERAIWLDPSIEVAPFEMIQSSFRGKPALDIENWNQLPSKAPLGNRIHAEPCWQKVGDGLPFSASQKVNLEASLMEDGKLSAKVSYSMRGDNELALRVAFHQNPKERWKELAQLLSITDGFRGHVTSVNVSDPYATKEPFSVEYELTQPKFVDWSTKKTVRIPALLPQLGLPDPPARSASGTATAPIELGTPLEVETRMTLNLPPGTKVSTPAGISVERDYATYASQYSVNGSTITASRHVKFILREVPADRAGDYNAFLHAVQSDEAQDFTLERSEATPSKTNSAAPSTTTSPKTVPGKP